MDEEAMEPARCWCGEALLLASQAPPSPGQPTWRLCPVHGAQVRSLWPVEARVTDLERRVRALEAQHEQHG